MMPNMRSRLKDANVLLRVQRSLKASHKRYYLAPPEGPYGVPRVVMKALMAEQLPSDVDVFNAKLQELLNHQKG
jgi:hypothetical protein